MLYVELYQKLNVVNKDISAIKCLLNVLRERDHVLLKKQTIIFVENGWNILQELWVIFQKSKDVCDYSHMPKESFEYLFACLYAGKILREKITVYGIFCPGYEGDSYKRRLGNTTVEKMENLKHLSELLKFWQIEHVVVCIYADSFLENRLETVEITDAFEYNKALFMEKASLYFNNNILLSVFLKDVLVVTDSYVDAEAMNQIAGGVYEKFFECNREFYGAMDWDEERIQKRTEELLTLYVIVANIIKETKHSIYAAIENMTERADLFVSKQIPVLFISKTREDRKSVV